MNKRIYYIVMESLFIERQPLTLRQAILQGVFLVLLFFLPNPHYELFYAATFVTVFELIEEIIITF